MVIIFQKWLKKGPDLQRILLIGDSIRSGYYPKVKKHFKQDVEIVTMKENGGDSSNVLKNIRKWLKKAKHPLIKIIHFNCGLHDIKRQFGSDENQVDSTNYAQNLRTIVKILQELPNIQLIWATTTPVISERHHAVKGFDRFEDDILTYNQIARSIIEEAGIPINDLNQVISSDSIDQYILPDGVHMTEQGNKLLEYAVIQKLRTFL